VLDGERLSRDVLLPGSLNSNFLTINPQLSGIRSMRENRVQLALPKTQN